MLYNHVLEEEVCKIMSINDFHDETLKEQPVITFIESKTAEEVQDPTYI